MSRYRSTRKDSLELKDSFWNEESLADVANTKRFLERFWADPGFRDLVRKDPESATDALEINVNVDALRPLWDPTAADSAKPLSTSVINYSRLVQDKRIMRDMMRNEWGQPDHHLFQKWRKRQMNRFYCQGGPLESAGLIHSTFTVELNQGCSVGCWFCGIDAPALTDTFRYTEENSRLWKGILKELHEVIGNGAQTGFCYWATDPFDNPDYESFLMDFRDEIGCYPQTTTAQPLKDIPRIKSLLQTTREDGPLVNRFSILSKGIFNAVHKAYTAQELLDVELVSQHSELMGKANAGRARNSERILSASHSYSTIACVSGFLVNMPRKEVRLISPVPACDRWPLGYRTYGLASFTDSQSFRASLEKLISHRMQVSLRLSDTIILSAPSEFVIEESKFTAAMQGFKIQFNHRENRQVLETLFQHLQTGPNSVTELMERMAPFHDMARVFYLLNMLFQAGLVDDLGIIDESKICV